MSERQKQLISFYLDPVVIMRLTAQAEFEGITRSELLIKYVLKSLGVTDEGKPWI